MTPLHPLAFEPILKQKVWGGRRLEMLGKRLPPTGSFGESWELADLDATSVSGGGGGAEHSRVARGPLEGRTIRQVMHAWGAGLLGAVRPTPQGGFPLLLKHLDASANLSVQTHPSPAYARSHPGAHLKTESWVVIDAAPGGVVYAGVKPGVTRAAFRRHVETGAVADDLAAHGARAGDCWTLPSGTVHALGAGVLVAEVQTPSDTTFRVFDWGRAGRELHLDAAMECIDFSPLPHPPAPVRLAPGVERLTQTTHFVIDRRVGAAPGGPEPATLDLPGASPVALMCLAGSGAVEGVRGDFERCAFRAGDTLLLPAGLPGARLTLSREAALLEVRLVV